MDWYRIVFETIDMRSFSNLWFWIALAVTWSSTSHWVIGVPFDMVARARRNGGQAERDLEDMVRINVNRLLYIAEEAGLWLVAIGSMLLTVLLILGVVYRIELAQAVFLLAFPMSMVGLMSVSTSTRIRATEPVNEDLWRRLTRHRLYTQMIGVASIFVTALWGMYQNMSAAVL